jgi:hypothetical protein
VGGGVTALKGFELLHGSMTALTSWQLVVLS